VRVLLVRPPVPPYTIGLKHIMICEPLELEYVAAGLPEHDVRILDLLLERGLERKLREFRPKVVGTSCYITGVNEAVRLCRTVKAWDPTCLTVVGGVHASQAPEDFADGAVDAVVLGDGTTVMPQVVAAVESGTRLEDIPGLALPEGDRVRRTAARPYMPPPDELPLPRRDLVGHLRHRYYYLFHQPVATIKTTWGCWYRCTFCFTWGITGGVPYARSPESITAELEQIEARDVYIVDDIFLINPQRLTRLAGLLRTAGIRKHYLAYGRADFIAEHEDLVAEWADLGLKAVFVGLEATTDPELDAMRKDTTVEVNRQAIAVLRRHGVDVYGSLITQPDYTPADWVRLRRFIDEHQLYYLNVSPLTPLPGTESWKALGHEITVPRRAHALWDLSHVVLPTRMPLKQYYRSLLGVYLHACFDPRRAARLSLRTAPPIWSPKFLRLWAGALKIARQFLTAHRHHTPRALRRAADRGPRVAPVA